LLPIGFVSLVAGVVLPRIEGKFSAGPSGLTAEILPVHRLDKPRFVISGPALTTEATEQTGSTDDGSTGQDAQRTAIGDVWDALEARGLFPDYAGLGHAYFRLHDERHLDLPNRGFMDWGTASDDLLAVLRTWGVKPIPSGKYSVQPEVDPEYAKVPAGSLRDLPRIDRPENDDSPS
jgi:hypothetical protein